MIFDFTSHTSSLRFKGDDYRPLNSLASGDLFNVIGVVTSIRPAGKSSKGGEQYSSFPLVPRRYYSQFLTLDWFRSLTLVDPSNCGPSDYGFLLGQGFRINCFTSKYEQWLPGPRIGEILIMQGIKVRNALGSQLLKLISVINAK